QIYPNPFNPNTTISYSLAATNKVRFAIFNSRGQVIKEMDMGSKNPGDYTITWDGKDQNGQAVSTGVYFIRMHAGGDSFSRKAVLMK
ncbi:MAG: FlgD immunoglobulin-like domain containing protein, partial [Candidatus Cloacimonetes bacterium]|nr:FlgD immunoglobulin-like domain containing protein [Candidatus Cloacimonadota bacterium]